MKTMKIANFAMLILAVVTFASCSESSDPVPTDAVVEQIKVENIVFKASNWDVANNPLTVTEIGGTSKPYTIVNNFTYLTNEFGEITITREKIEDDETRNYTYIFGADSVLTEILVANHWKQQFQYEGNKLSAVYSFEYNDQTGNYEGAQRDEITWTGNAITKILRYGSDFVELVETYTMTPAATDNSFVGLSPALALCAMEEFEYVHFFTGKDFASLSNEPFGQPDQNFSYEYSNTYDTDGLLNFMNRVGSGATKPNSNIGLVWIKL